MILLLSRREALRKTLLTAGSLRAAARLYGTTLVSEYSFPASEGARIRDESFAFLEKCHRKDGGYNPSPDPGYRGSSDTAESDLAAVTYAAVLAKTFQRKLPGASRSAEFIQSHQQPDGVFVNHRGNLKPTDDLAVLYNTVQGAVGLRALGEQPRINPVHVMDRFFENGRFRKLPWYTMSFYPLFYAALGAHFPDDHRKAIESWLTNHQASDGYVGDHVASTFHLVHFFRLIGRAAPRSSAIVERVMKDQRPNGGWHLRPPDWDVHACFDAVFILRQLGGHTTACRVAIDRGADWALSCRTADGGFSHYPGEHSDVDAVYFQLGTLIQAGRIPGADFDLRDADTLGWGHAMKPGKIYSNG
ncbi:MAG TPA: prenyltransferase/squalene oxidase repeat-containing protein [Terriglobia bacterium]|nr:prenyltransferase/squalene oxidase repeat-containing protein [Terriglobia bacterium]